VRWSTQVVGRAVRVVALGSAALVGSLLVPTGLSAQGIITTNTTSFSSSTHLTEQTVEVNECSPGVAVGTRTLTSSHTGDTVTTGAIETETDEQTVGPGTIIIGDRDNGGTAFEVLDGTVNINHNTHTHTETMRTTTNTYLTGCTEVAAIVVVPRVAG
jgi:hypothetical protein